MCCLGQSGLIFHHISRCMNYLTQLLTNTKHGSQCKSWAIVAKIYTREYWFRLDARLREQWLVETSASCEMQIYARNLICHGVDLETKISPNLEI